MIKADVGLLTLGLAGAVAVLLLSLLIAWRGALFGWRPVTERQTIVFIFSLCAVAGLALSGIQSVVIALAARGS